MKRLFLFFFFLIAVSLHAEDLNLGLYIKSNQYTGAQRTGLILNDRKPFQLSSKGVSLSFDLYIRKEPILFGFINRIITNTGENIDLLISPNNGEHVYVSLLVNEKRYNIATIEHNRWIPVKISLLPENKQIELTFGSQKKSFEHSFSNVHNFQVSFGACRIPKYKSPEAAPINIKNIRVYEGNKLIRYWQLGKHQESFCLDSIRHIPAHADNPIWLINTHSKWEKVFSIKQKDEPQFDFDPIHGIFYFLSNQDLQTLYTYNVVTRTERIIKDISGYPAGDKNDGLFYIPDTQELISFDLNNKTLSRYMPATNEWENKSVPEVDMQYYDHTQTYNPTDTSIITFGGYGHYIYKNDLFKIKPYTGKWEKIKIEDIDPRFFATSAVVDNNLYISGGRGCKSGRQEMSPHNYYDLYKINLQTFKTEKLWNIEMPDTVNIFPGRNMIYNSSDNSFYVLIINPKPYLVKIRIDKPGLERVSDDINVDLKSDERINYTLYQFPEKQKIYALFCKQYKDSTSLFDIYSIHYPTLSYVDTLQEKSEPKIFYTLLGIAIVLASIAFIFFKRKNNSSETKAPIIKPETSLPSGSTDQEEVKRKPIFNSTHSCIRLLGKFQVKDKEGNDISGSFTPILKSLLLLILLHSQKDERGITNKKIDETLWGDKSEKSAQNNRNVSLSKLRSLLEKIGNVRIVQDNNFWKIESDNPAYCDYQMALQYIQEATNSQHKEESFFYDLLELLFYGPLLPNTQFDWLDNFKSDYSCATIDLLNELLKKEEFLHNDKFRLQIAETIFSHDILNEEALQVKCTLLYNSGKKGIAKNTYDNFCKEYHTLLGVEYNIPFSQIIHANE